MTERWVSPCGRMELRQGDWREVLIGVGRCDSWITDPPYSERTIRGARSGGGRDSSGWQGGTAGIFGYGSIDADGIAALEQSAAAREAKWFVMFGDHYMMRWAEEGAPDDWYVYAPVPWVKTNAAPRMAGDGPSPQSESIFVARRKMQLPLRYRPGWYVSKQARAGEVTGAKPLSLMRQVIGHYSEPGDLIIDPFAGGGTTLLAAAIEGRRAIGAEIDPETFRKAVKRLSAGYTPAFVVERKPRPKQGVLV